MVVQHTLAICVMIALQRGFTASSPFYLKEVNTDSETQKTELISSVNGDRVAWTVYRNTVNTTG